MKVSIVVPVYNTEKYLKRCIDSLLNQKFNDYEIIVINDCSPDNSEDIIKSYSDKKINYIKNDKNKGIGYNRNLGIKNAKGKYICFIDSDDYVSNDFLDKMYNYASSNDLDLVVCDYMYKDEDTNKETLFKLESFDITNLDERPDLLYKIPLGPCNKLYKKDMLIKNNIYFEEKLKYEDVSFVASSLYYSNSIGKIDEILNFFSTRSKSETTTRDERVFDIFKELDIVKEIYKSKNKYLDELIVSTLFNYSVQQRYQKDYSIAKKFIDKVFDYLEESNIDYKHSLYIKTRGIRGIIEKSKILTKIYCFVYIKIK